MPFPSQDHGSGPYRADSPPASPAPPQGAPASCSQLLYTNVDRVADGRALSGWQIMAASADLGEEEAQRLSRLIQPVLSPVRSLSSFPTAEEIAGAERRLAQVPLGDDTVFVHTAPAGLDTTGRPNTVTHLLRLGQEPAPVLTGPDLWRSNWWVTPFGAENVRAATLPDPQALRAGPLDDDAVADFIAAGRRGPVLGAIADALEAGLGAGRAGEPRLVVVACDSTDEAAAWTAALARTCAGATFRRVGVSTLERIAGDGDVDGLLRQGITLAFAPRDDALGGRLDRAKCLVIDPAAEDWPAPAGAWGRLARAAADDLGAWVAATESMRDVLSVLPDHRDLTPAWPLAMAEACEPGLFASSQDDALTAMVERELVACHPRALATSAYLTAVVNDRVLGSTVDDPESWYSKLAAVPAGSPVAGVAGGLARKYLETASRHPDWLAAPRTRREDVTQLLQAWSAAAGNQAVADTVFSTAYRAAAEQADRSHVGAGVQAVDALVRDGLPLTADLAAALLGSAASALVNDSDPDHRELLALDPCAGTRSRVAALVDDRLRDLHAYDPKRPLPLLAPAALAWLVQDQVLVGMPWIALEAAVNGLRSEANAAGAVALVQALQGVRAAPRLPDDVLSLLADHLTAAQALAVPRALPGWWRIVGPCLVHNPADPVGLDFARRYLRSEGLSERRLRGEAITFRSWQQVVCGAVLLHSVPIMTAEPLEVATIAANVLKGIEGVRRRQYGADVPNLALGDARNKALVALVVAMWAGIQVPVQPDGLSMSRALDTLPQWLEQHPAALSPRAPHALGHTTRRLVALAFLRQREGRLPEDLRDWSDDVLNNFDLVQERSAPVLADRDDIALTAVRVWVGMLDERVRAQAPDKLRDALQDAPGAERWLAKEVFGSAGRFNIRSRIFGGR
ncbi:hypothetical protein [Actinomyces procaprae]|uniref:GAP1-N2 domain-containing protein n=1 Tax=Actinomyces procaprae TaxID=2560010 RepID=UPI00109D993B|nr:hypothetical protein [Actinomyces procaprae]